jgi:hypothetical protein
MDFDAVAAVYQTSRLMFDSAANLAQTGALIWIIRELRRSRRIAANGSAQLRRSIERNGHNGNGGPLIGKAHHP